MGIHLVANLKGGQKKYKSRGSNIIKDRESLLLGQGQGGGGVSRLGCNQDFMDTALLFCLRLAPRIFDVLERIDWSGIKSYRVVFGSKDATIRIY